MNTKKFIVPSGAEVTIREQNGEDDSILSNVGLAKKGEHIHTFIQGLIQEHSEFGKRPTLKEVSGFRIADRIVILLQSRMFSLGSEFKFLYQWQEGDKVNKTTYVENLERYLLDYGKKDWEEGELEKIANEDPYVILPCKLPGKDISFESPITGNQYVMDYLTGTNEKELTEIGEDNMNINVMLTIRNLKIIKEDGVTPITNFSMFTAKEMAFLRKQVTVYDPAINPVTEVVHPTNKSVVEFLPIMDIPDFFYPAEI